MSENLIAGYAEYTTADELVADSAVEAPATLSLVALSVASFGLSANTVTSNC
ncbi:LxmA leader domain family RiPP [Streptacidiphilus carbonis]|jgi:hypothetical protein|uniref:LxmA leader domain family RiPP n=1 Tax=Streptacidiphilus carbonis TaxID=105422 RepID=UPI000ACAA98D|nr:LxmA leader domain family RiPP [Streptacidiphilus carbonis]